MRPPKIALVLLAGSSLLGCEEKPAASPPPSSLTTTRQIIQSNGLDAAVQAELELACLDAGLDPAVRLVALRKLEEARAPGTTRVAAALARGSVRELAVNAVAVRARSDSDEARASLAALPPELQRLAARVAARATE